MFSAPNDFFIAIRKFIKGKISIQANIAKIEYWLLINSVFHCFYSIVFGVILVEESIEEAIWWRIHLPKLTKNVALKMDIVRELNARMVL